MEGSLGLVLANIIITEFEKLVVENPIKIGKSRLRNRQILNNYRLK